MSKPRARNSWVVTPVQAIIGRRVGFRNHLPHWAGGLAFMYVAGVVTGRKIGRERDLRRPHVVSSRR